MRKILWSIPLVFLLLLLAAITWLLYTESGLRWVYAQAQTRLSGTLTIENIHGRLSGPLNVRTLRYADGATNITVRQLAIDWSPWALLRGYVDISELSVAGVDVSMKSEEKSEKNNNFSLPLSISIDRAELRDVTLRRAESAPYHIASVDFSGHVNNDRATIDQLKIVADNFQLEAHGALGARTGNDRLVTTWRIELPSTPAIAGTGTITGHLNALSLSQQLTEPTAASINARLDNALTKPTWHLTANVPELALRQLHATAPDTKISATLDANGDAQHFRGSSQFSVRLPDLPAIAAQLQFHGSTAGDIALEPLQVSVPGTDARLTASATLSAAKTWKAQLTWNALAWPLTGAARVISDNGKLDASGSLTAYQFTSDFALSGANLPSTQWHSAGTGDRERLRLEQLSVAMMDNTVRGNADVQWSPRIRWSAQLEGAELNPASVWADWPGTLSLRARLSGDDRRQHIDVNELKGTLRGYPLRAQLKATREGENFPDLAATLSSGDLRAQIHGAIGTNWNLSWNLEAPSLAAAFPGASGHVSSTGTVHGPRAVPNLRTKLTASDVAYQALRIGELHANTELDLSDRTPSRLDVRTKQLRWGSYEIDTFTISAGGRLSSHTIATAINSAGVELRTKLTGRYANASWNGAVDDSVWKINTEEWRLRERAPLHVATDRIALAPICWRSATAAEICTSLTYSEATNVSLQTQRVPLAMFAPLLPTALTVNGTMSGKLQAQRSKTGALIADGGFDFAPGDITLSGASPTTLSYQNAEVRLRADTEGLRANATFVLANGDRANANVSLPQFNSADDAARQPVTGRMTASLRELTPFAALFPELAELRGSLMADIILEGTLDDPAVQGKAELLNASARLPAIGVHLEDVRLTLTPASRQTLRLTGFARSGDGELGLSGQLTFGRGLTWHAEARVAGARFLAMDVPEAKVYVTPDLRAQLAPGQITLKGDLRIPEAHFKARVRRESIAAVSRDVVMVNTNDQGSRASQTPWNVTAEVRVILGERVTIEGYGLNALVSGELVLIDIPGQVTTGRGELRVTRGDYEAYGEKLELERGRLLFLGGPVTNPGIDARAVRHVDTITAGVEVKGTLQSPQLTLFSDPTMGQADALSYLLFGKPVEGADAAQGRSLAGAARALRLAGGEQLAQRLGARFGIEEVEIESGSGSEQAALVLGKRLSPRLYINYSIGLFEQSNIFRIRYQLSKSWSVEAQSGTTTTGGDLLYTIER